MDINLNNLLLTQNYKKMIINNKGKDLNKDQNL